MLGFWKIADILETRLFYVGLLITNIYFTTEASESASQRGMISVYFRFGSDSER